MVGLLFYGFLYVVLNAIRATGWVRWHVEGLEHLPPRSAGGMIIVTNHIHWLDIPLIGALLPFSYRLSWLAKAELFKYAITNWFFTAMSVIPVKRGRRDLAALDAAEQALGAGVVLLIYPEGHRSHNGQLQQGRGGAIRLAMRSQCPLVPVAIAGTEYGLWGILLLRKPVMLRIGKPYTVEATSDGKIPPAQMEQLTHDVMLRLTDLLPSQYWGYYSAASAARRLALPQR